METIPIKNMVCARCILVVQQIVQELNLSGVYVELGSISIENDLDTKTKYKFKQRLEAVGFEILTKAEDQVIEQVKNALIEAVEDRTQLHDMTLQGIISERILKNYHQISRLFSSTEGKTIERYFIELKIEKAKELIKYEHLSVSEIAYDLGYSSPQHLARQFKQVTGITTSEFKKNGVRSKLDTL